MPKNTLVFLPGLLSNQKVFQYQIEHLKDLADILIVDLTDVDSPAAMTEKILRLAPENFLLAGHSIGGWVALRIMKIAPERVIKLCILNTSARGIEANELISRQSVLDRLQNNEFKIIASEIANKFTFNKSVVKQVFEMFLQVGEQALINQTRAMMLREDLCEILPKINCPTSVIHAAEDQRFSLDMLQEISNNIYNAKLSIVNHCGHMSLMESPIETTQLLRNWIV